MSGNRELEQHAPEDLAESFSLCSDHFEDEMFVNAKQKQRLVSSAVPTKFGTEADTHSPEIRTKRKRPPKTNLSKRPRRSGTEKQRKSPLVCHALRLRPGEDLKCTLQNYVNKHSLLGAFVLSCVGSLAEAEIRLADAETYVNLSKPHEILSLSGTVSGGGHLHISLSDEEGKVIGGHLAGKSIVHTTAEIVLGELPRLSFTREMDAGTEYKELVIREREGTDSEEAMSEEAPRKMRKNSKQSRVKLISNEDGIPVVSVNGTLLSITKA